MPEPSLPDKVVAVHRALDGAGIGHAFGGALALAYYAEPRATVDIDVNVFVEPARYPAVLAAVAPLGVEGPADATRVVRDGQVRVRWGRTPLDLFFACDPVHDAMRRAARVVPFGDTDIPILAAAHLVIAEVWFNRAKDWLDVEQVLVLTPAFDTAEVHGWLDHLVGPDDERAVRFRALASRLLHGT